MCVATECTKRDEEKERCVCVCVREGGESRAYRTLYCTYIGNSCVMPRVRSKLAYTGWGRARKGQRELGCEEEPARWPSFSQRSTNYSENHSQSRDTASAMDFWRFNGAWLIRRRGLLSPILSQEDLFSSNPKKNLQKGCAGFDHTDKRVE